MESKFTKEYTIVDMHAAWHAGYRNAEYRFRLLPTHVVGTGRDRISKLSDDAMKDISRALERGDNRFFSRWLSDYEDALEYREKHGVNIEPDGMRILPKQSTDNVPPII